MSRANLNAVLHALAGHHPVKATVQIEAESGGERRAYVVVVGLSWR